MMKILTTIIDLSVFGFVSALGVGLTNWILEYWPEIPEVFKLMWVIGLISVCLYTWKINWAWFLNCEVGE